MKCLLIYFTGTFNTRYITTLVKGKLIERGVEVETYEIDPLNKEKLDLSQYDMVGLGYPIYGFNAPLPYLQFIKRQRFPEGMKVFIYKNSGETLHANDASSISVYRHLKRCKANVTNEYHFIMPYNIHFRFEEPLIKEMLGIDDMLGDILAKEVTEGINNFKKYKFIPRVIAFFVKLQFIGGPINSFFYRVDKKSCIDCGLCIKDCPTKNIYKNKRGAIKFHHNCLMCMRCSFRCPKDSIRIGYLEGWRVNGPYNFEKIKKIENKEPIITDKTEGFFKCYIETYNYVETRHKELFPEA